MSKYVMQLKRDGEIDEAEGTSTDVKSFAEATFLLVEDLANTAEKNWSVEIIGEWLKQFANELFPSPKTGVISVTKADQECEWTFSYEYEV